MFAFINVVLENSVFWVDYHNTNVRLLSILTHVFQMVIGFCLMFSKECIEYNFTFMTVRI